MAQLRYKKLPRTLYKVRVPKIALYSPEELEYYGMPVSVINNGQKIQKYKNEESICYLTIAQMIDIHKQGYRIELLMHDDLVEIYKAVEDYIRESTNNAVDNLNRPGHTVEDEELADMDKFAAEIFGWNRYEIVDETVNKPIKQWDFIPLPDFTGTVNKKNNNVNFAKPSGLSMNSFAQPSTINGYQSNYQSVYNPSAYNNQPVYNQQQIYNDYQGVDSYNRQGSSFPFNPRVETVTGHQTGYVPRYNPVTSSVPNKDQYTNYYHSNMPTVDPSKVQRKSYNPYGGLFNNKGKQS